MLLFKKVDDLQAHLQQLRAKGERIGFAPTMGALHQGHLSLLERSKRQNDCTVCSIFVNPTQFNDAADLEKYPRTTTTDIELLTSIDTDVLFLPSVEEIYPTNLNTTTAFDFASLATVMEGAFRKGHFDGMAQVVKRFLDIVQPNALYMGQKDFQQLTIVRNMLQQMQSNIELVMCPIIREKDGLAMSSRNIRLTPENRTKATLLYQTLQAAKANFKNDSVEKLAQKALEKLAIPDFKAEYFEIVDGISLQKLTSADTTSLIVACTAVWAGDIRLIDNIILKEA